MPQLRQPHKKNHCLAGTYGLAHHKKNQSISACFLATDVAPIFIASTVALSHPWLGKMWPATKQALSLAWMLHPLVQ